MKINKVNVFHLSSKFASKNSFGTPLGLKTTTIIEITTDNKLKGIGEIYLGIYTPKLIDPIINNIEKFIKNKNPIDLTLKGKKIHIPFVSRNGLYNSVYSGIDIALWDIVSKFKKKPLHALISNLKNDYKIYSSGGLAKSNLNEIREDIKKAKLLKHAGFKMRVGVQSWKKDFRRIKFAYDYSKKKQLNLMVDFIMGTIKIPNSRKQMIKKIKNLEKFKIKWIEEPFHPDDYFSFKELKKKSLKIPIASGEALNSLFEYNSYISNNLVDIIQLDVTHCGGITEALKILSLLKNTNKKVALHVWGSTISLSANAHLAYAVKNIKWLECPLHQPAINKNIKTHVNFTKNLKFQKLKCGLGVDLNTNIKKKYPYVEGSEYKI